MRSCRRTYLDNFLNKKSHLFHGNVIDIGGEKTSSKGKFNRPKNVVSWTYLNSSIKTKPDLHCDAEFIPIANKKIECFLLSEVLEHLIHPEKVINEAYRILKPGGIGIITMPFMYAKHGDPEDYQRWTDSKLTQVLVSAGFNVLEIVPMGGIFSVICDFIIIMLWSLQSSIYKKIALRVAYKLVPTVMFMDRMIPSSSLIVPTGWGIIVRVNG